uniref:Uncharacterized protein n=1 Tax=Anguilla anguilla TaxID=7936 RepID=A0A0E9XL39_ANGAN
MQTWSWRLTMLANTG